MKAKYSEEMLAFIKANCTLSNADLHRTFCEQFNRYDISPTKLRRAARERGWKTGRTGRFEKGHQVWNKDKRYNRSIIHPNSLKNQFKQGYTPPSYVPVGTQIVSTEGYIREKIAEPNSWKLLHHLVWENAHGEVPNAHVVMFLDGNKLNCELSNLECIPRSVLARINRLKKSVHTSLLPQLTVICQLDQAISNKLKPV